MCIALEIPRAIANPGSDVVVVVLAVVVVAVVLAVVDGSLDETVVAADPDEPVSPLSDVPFWSLPGDAAQPRIASDIASDIASGSRAAETIEASVTRAGVWSHADSIMQAE